MVTLAVRSVRKRPGRFAATLLSAFLGATIVMTFNSLLDTAGADGVDAVSKDILTTSAAVVGGYGSLLVFFAIASTLTVNVRQRSAEIELLRCSGATPAQIRRMVVGESAVVAVVAALLAVGPAVLAGRALVGLFHDSGQVAGSVDHVFGPAAIGSGLAVTVTAAAGAAFLAVRRATRWTARRTTSPGRGRTFLTRAALITGAVAVTVTFALDSTGEALMAPPVYGSILLAAGFGTGAPALLKRLVGALPLRGPSAYLAVRALKIRAAQLSGVLLPLTLFTGMAVATLCMQAVENDAIDAAGVPKSVDAKTLETLNLTVVGIIVVFSCIMLVNSLYAATTYRRKEFGQQRLAGATPGQVLGMIGIESAVLTVTGVFFGTVAALAGIIPFTMVRTDAVLPEWGTALGIWFGIAGVAAVAVFGTSLVTARRALRAPAISAVTLAA
ncbi:ABC transporter permease [Streptomyces sp. V3I8]|uniref:ABC transporter permease n=1 Tax=Streptomyces sp. V3I8 TaxID=3042279 RepID=UPI0027D78F29|nr:ABC transporter permease [Streptomyces sp. V3I8]